MKVTSLIAAVSVAVALSQNVYAAEYAEETNVLSDYSALEWSGDALYYDNSSETIFFKSVDEREKQDVYYTVSFTGQAPTGLWFYVDIGNGASSDSGGAIISFYSDDERLLSIQTGDVTQHDNYRRYSAGAEETFLPMPEGAKYLTIHLYANDNDKNDTVDVYFRNFSAVFSNECSLAEVPDDFAEMEQSGDLTKVEIGTSNYTQWIWIGLIFVVAMIFYAIRVIRQKYKTNAIIKPKKTYEK